MAKVAVIVLGNRRSGKSTTWNTLFGRTVRTGAEVRALALSDETEVPVFLVSGSPEERKEYVGKIVGDVEARVVLCSLQYTDHARDTINYFIENGYGLYAQWLNPGFDDQGPQLDTLGFVPYLLHRGATLSIRDGQVDPKARVSEIREFLLGWASSRRLAMRA